MPKGQLYINGKDAFTEWGISLESTALSALLTPAPNKALPENKSRLLDGKTFVEIPRKVDERTVVLPINLIASSEQQFFEHYNSFCEELAKGKLEIKTSFQPGKIYYMEYISCNQFTQFMRGIANFSLKLCEPNPTR